MGKYISLLGGLFLLQNLGVFARTASAIEYSNFPAPTASPKVCLDGVQPKTTRIDLAELFPDAIGFYPVQIMTNSNGNPMVSTSIESRTVDSNGQNKSTFLIQYNCDGSLDRSFGTRGLVKTELSVLQGLVRHPNGGFVAYGRGRAAEYPLSGQFTKIVRILENGKRDTKFGTDGVFLSLGPKSSNGVSTLKIRPDNTILFIERNILYYLSRKGVLQYQKELPKDLALSGDMTIDSRGRLLGIGSASDPFEISVKRLTSTGELDQSFGEAGKIILHGGPIGIKNKIWVDDRDQVYVLRTRPGEDFAELDVRRYSERGNLDLSYEIPSASKPKGMYPWLQSAALISPDHLALLFQDSGTVWQISFSQISGKPRISLNKTRQLKDPFSSIGYTAAQGDSSDVYQLTKHYSPGSKDYSIIQIQRLNPQAP